MRKKLMFAAMFVVVLMSCKSNMNTNPLLVDSTNPYGAPSFDKIKLEHYKPAFEAAMTEGRAEISSIIKNTEAPNFENTIEALEFAGRRLSSISSIFFNLNEANTDSTMQQIAIEVSPLLSAYSNEILLNDSLFQRIKVVYDNRSSLGLNEEKLRLVEETFRGFEKNGANLPEESKSRFKEINSELSKLSLEFNQNVLAATNKFFIQITDSAELAGLPDFVIDNGASEAKDRGLEGWVYTLQAPSFSPFLQYSENRDLKKKLWMAYNTRCLNDDFDNQKIVTQIVSLRLEKAKLLGYKNYAEYVLVDNMAKDPATVTSFLNDLLDKTIDYAKKDVTNIGAYAKTIGFKGNLMPWDFSYYSEKYKSERFSINDELLKPYFKLENVQNAIFALADSLYGLKFKENSKIPVYHQDVKVFEVSDESGRVISILYLDYFPRASKSGGAWMTTFREKSTYKNQENIPLVSLVCNFTKPTEKSPSLLTFYEFTTLLHEFGHALHGMLAEGNYSSLTGTNVVRDFVELPSQIMENWAVEKDYLNSFAKHYQTGEVIPEDLVNKIIESKNYLAAYSNVRQLTFGIADMAFHTLEKSSVDFNINSFEKSSVAKTRVIEDIPGTGFSTSFGHIFAGGYSAGYYSYKWAEVLEADAFSLFKEKGIFNKEVSASFRKNILSKGNLKDADMLYREFRGRDPRPEALIEKMGLSK